MSHLTELQCLMLADSALSSAEAAPLQQHLETCPTCADRLQAVTNERQVIQAVLTDDAVVTIPEKLPAFKKPVGLRNLALANLATGLLLWLAQFMWKTLFGELIVNAFTRLTAIYIPDTYDLVVSTLLYFFNEGTTMIDNYFEIIAAGLLVISLAGLAVFLGRSRMMFVSFLLLAITMVTTDEASALDVRHDQHMLTIAAGETVSDSLFVAGETVVIDGIIEGDLLAFAQRVIINGEVRGNVLTAAESVSIFGQVNGTVASAGRTVELGDAIVDGDFWAAANKITIDRGSRVTGNATMASESINIAGSVGRDGYTFAETVEVSGSIAADLEAFARQVSLIGEARIGGNLRLRTEHEREDSLQQSPAALVGGVIEFVDMPEELRDENRYTTPEFYFGQLIRLAGAFIVGLALLWLLPRLRYVELEGGAEGFKNAGIGLVALVSTPIVLVLVAITLVGLPIAAIGLFTWILAIYLAKVLLASVIGNMIIDSPDRGPALPLLAGLVVIVVATNIPGIGGILNFLLTVVGFGLIYQVVDREYR